MLFSKGQFVALLHKEISELFSSAVAYIVIAVFLSIVAYTFTTILFFQRSVTVIHALAQAANLLLLIVPVITMRQFSKERESGTLELILSTPSGELELVLSKYLACMLLIVVMLVASFAFPVTLGLLGSPDYGATASAYLGLFLFSTALVALGLCIASFFSNPIIAALVSLGVFVSLWMIEVLSDLLPGVYYGLPEAVSLDIHLSRFFAGAIFLSDCSFFLLLTLGSLMICIHRLSYR